MIQALITVFRITLMHITRHLSPRLLFADVAGAQSRNGFDINRGALLDPVMFFGN